jgi:ubiquinone/menaquinone biosynthesis C-methylase UbiE
MNKIKKSYKDWSKIYDTNKNETRDLDQIITKKILSKITFDSILEIGCGTGKNTTWFSEKANSIIAVDFSPEMLKIAKNKINSNRVNFKEADITKPWSFNNTSVDLISINLVLEHVENLNFIFKSANETLKNNGYLFISELHPYKQYLGSQAMFNNELVTSFTHQISDYFTSAGQYNFQCIELIESFDKFPDKENENIPRLISILFKKV